MQENTSFKVEAVKVKETQGTKYPKIGYGSKLPMRYMVKYFDDSKWYRVYCCIWSNSGTVYTKLGYSLDLEHSLSVFRETTQKG